MPRLRSAELLFRHKVMRLLQGEGLLSEERTELLLSWRHTGFSVHNRVCVEPEDQPAVERLARYIMRPPISLDRMSWDGEGEVRYRRKRGHESSGAPVALVETFDPVEVCPESGLKGHVGACSPGMPAVVRGWGAEEETEVSTGGFRGGFGFGMRGTLGGVEKEFPIPFLQTPEHQGLAISYPAESLNLG